MKLPVLKLFAVLGVAAASVLILVNRWQQPISLRLLVAASQRPVLTPLVDAYQKQTGQQLEIRYGGSQDLIVQMLNSTPQNPIDLFIPADDSYLKQPAVIPLIDAPVPLGRMHVVVLPARDNPRQIQSWDTLVAADTRIAFSRPDLAAIGKLTQDALTQSGRWEPLHARIVVLNSNVSESANAARLGSVDAAIIWNVMARSYPDQPIIELPELRTIRANVAAAQLRATTHPIEAQAFLEFITSPAQRQHWRDFGFEVPGQ